MADLHPSKWIEDQVEDWRRFLRRRRGDPGIDGKLEGQLRTEIANLSRAGLAPDEAFWVAVKRVGDGDAIAGEFARAHAARWWKPADGASSSSGARGSWLKQDSAVALGFAVAAAVAIKLPALFGVDGKGGADVLARNAGVLVLPCLTAFFAWKRRVARSTIAWLAGVFAVAAVLANLPEFGASRAFEALTALHLPIALSMAVGVAYVGGRWREESGRMDFIRFSGEWFIHYVLIALGGGVLCAFMALTFHTIGIDIEHFFGSWLLPCGAAGAVVIASWWAEAKQNVVENIAPVLTRIFTPLFAAMLIAFLAALVWSGRVVAIDRDLLIGFDLLLVVVLGLVVYSMSARDPHAPRGTFDVLQVALVVSALLADAVALAAIAARIGEFGLSPNRVAALGENIILLTNLAGSGVLYLRFLLGRGTFRALERWQTGFLPVYAIWAAIVVAVFPIVFRFV